MHGSRAVQPGRGTVSYHFQSNALRSVFTTSHFRKSSRRGFKRWSYPGDFHYCNGTRSSGVTYRHFSDTGVYSLPSTTTARWSRTVSYRRSFADRGIGGACRSCYHNPHQSDRSLNSRRSARQRHGRFASVAARYWSCNN